MFNETNSDKGKVLFVAAQQNCNLMAESPNADMRTLGFAIDGVLHAAYRAALGMDFEAMALTAREHFWAIVWNEIAETNGYKESILVRNWFAAHTPHVSTLADVMSKLLECNCAKCKPVRPADDMTGD